MSKYIISGASSGVGLNLAETLLSMGRKVIGCGRRECVDVHNMEYYSLDYTDKYTFDTIDHDDIDGIIHCSAQFNMAPLSEHSSKDISDMVNTNLISVIEFVKYFQQRMKKNGNIILVSSVSGLRGQLNQTVYSATKHAIQGFADSLRQEVPQKITTICPGGINTPLWDDTLYPGNRNELLTPQQISDVIINILDSSSVVFKNITLYPENETH